MQPGKYAARASQFSGIADGRTRGVAFDERDIGWHQPRHFVGGANGLFLPLFGRRQQPCCAAIVTDPHATNHREHAVTRGLRVFEAFEHHEPGPFGGQQAIGILMERAALAGRADGFQGAETDVEIEVV